MARASKRIAFCKHTLMARSGRRNTLGVNTSIAKAGKRNTLGVNSMERIGKERTKFGRKEAGQASRGHDQPEIITEEAEKRLSTIDEEPSSSSSSTMDERYKSLTDALNENTNEAQTPKPQIQRVPFMLRDHLNFKKYYEPRVIAIGPLHHGKPHLQPAEKLKLKLAALFLKDSGLRKEDLYGQIWTEIKALRQCYDRDCFDGENPKFFDDEELAWMLFVDGCAVLHAIKLAANEKLGELKIKNDQIAYAQQDLFLLENQLPFQVLQLLISSNSDSEKKWRDYIEKYIEKFSPVNIMEPEEPQHHKKQHQQTNQQQQQQQQLQQQQEKIMEPTHLLELLRAKLLGTSMKKEACNCLSFLGMPNDQACNCVSILGMPKKESYNWQSIRNVKELKAAGIYVRRSRTSYLTDISFTSMCVLGQLKLPPIRVDDSTGPIFLNLIAYEMCPDFDNDFGVTSYICFLDSLIDQPEDVMALRKSRILQNFLGSDEEVAKLFNEISTDLVPNPDTYEEVKVLIQKHYESRFMTWVAEAYHKYFNNPWSIFAFLGAVVALILTAIQTWYTVP